MRISFLSSRESNFLVALVRARLRPQKTRLPILASLQKGIMSLSDPKKSVAFAKKVKKSFPATVSTEFYLDGVNMYVSDFI